MLKDKRVVVTGGAGFVGSHLCRVLSEFNEVHSIDNYYTGCKTNHQKNVTYHHGNSKDISNLLEGKFDCVFHFGEYSRVEQSFNDFDFVMRNNSESLPSILRFCKKHGAKLIYSGSSTKFTNDTLGLYQSPYAYTKSINTQLIEAFANWYELEYAVVYFYNVYGPNEISKGKYATVVAKFIQAYTRGKPLPVVLPGTQKRNFTHIDDIISGVLMVAEQGAGDLYGIGSDESFSIIELANMISGNINFLPERKGNRSGAILEVDKIKALGWSCKHSIKDYLRDIVKV